MDSDDDHPLCPEQPKAAEPAVTGDDVSVMPMLSAFDALLRKTSQLRDTPGSTADASAVHELALAAVRQASAAHEAMVGAVEVERAALREERATVDAHHLRVLDRLRALQRQGDTTQAERLQRATAMACSVEESLASLHPHALFARAAPFRDDAMLEAARAL